jgi:hypothetical protein
MVFAIRARDDHAILAATDDDLDELIGFVAAEANNEPSRRRAGSSQIVGSHLGSHDVSAQRPRRRRPDHSAGHTTASPAHFADAICADQAKMAGLRRVISQSWTITRQALAHLSLVTALIRIHSRILRVGAKRPHVLSYARQH